MPLRLPPPLRTGDRIGVAALSGPVDPARLEAGLSGLAELGFEPVPARNLRAREDLFAGSDRERLEGFHELAADPHIAAIFFARGGHGLLRVLPEIDWPLLARRPRAYVGYSDLTPFLLEVVRRLRRVAFHGPMVAADLARGLDARERESLLAALAGEPETSLPLAGVMRAPRREAAGPLLGGCLSMLVSVLGTPWAPRLGGAVLLLEDVGEPLFRLDRMLTHLRLSGSLARIRGIVIGAMRGADEVPDATSTVPSRVADLFPGAAVAWGLDAGHVAPNRTLPLGARCRIDAAASRLLIEVSGPSR
ncbi:MAG: LD-carboxypeptidase [Thermoanaerobaculia bacterium]|nr:MAG: LD-carboxypeptidase [Thermoanaerobaculia bacterium]